MTVYTTLLPHQFLTTSDLVEMTEFPTVAARGAVHLNLYVTRAHIMLGNYLPFDDQGELARFESEMQVATFMLAESLALANPSRAAAAAGFTSETIGKYSYSRAPGGSSTGEGVKGDLIPDEVLYILERWSTADDDAIRVATTEVFTEAPLVSGTELRRFGLGDDLDLAGAGDELGWSTVSSPRG